VLLEERGVNVLEAGDGAAALQRLETTVVDAVITDFHMPRLDGIGLAEGVRTAALACRPPLLALSAREDAGWLDAARAAGIVEFVTKPVKSGELFPALARMLNNRTATAPAAPPAADEQVLDVARLDSLRSHGILDEALPGAMRAARRLFESLPQPVAARDHDATTEQLHALVGICGNIGAHALHRRLRAIYVQLVEHGQWPEPGWHEELLALHAATARALREQYALENLES